MKGRNLVILFGGNSDEHLVSVATAQNLARALPGSTLWWWSPRGAVHAPTHEELLSHVDPFSVPFHARTPAIGETLRSALAVSRPDVIVLGLHGQEGEDGTVQRLLEDMNIPFTGSSSVASGQAFDKIRAKQTVRAHGILVPGQYNATGDIRSATDFRDLCERLLREWGGVVLKPSRGGSSLGLALVRASAEVPAAVRTWRKIKAQPYLLEELIQGHEVSVGVMEDENDVPGPLAATEIRVPSSLSFDYHQKYLAESPVEITPARLPKKLLDRAFAVAVEVHRRLGCRGYSRSDLILRGSEAIFLETNTLPGLTANSIVPQQLSYAGLTIQAFVEGQVARAFRAARSRTSL